MQNHNATQAYEAWLKIAHEDLKAAKGLSTCFKNT